MSHLTPIALSRLPRHQIEMMIQRLTAGKHLPDGVIQHLIEKTDGVPLYVEEMTKTLLESGHLKESDAGYQLMAPLDRLAIPATLQDSLMARLDKLDSAKGVAQLGATIGRQFSYDLLQAVSPLSETILQRELKKLVDAELIYQRGAAPNATYLFKHALIQDTAYESLLRSTRQHYHQRLAQVLVDQ
jgi:predicted ATPase